MHFHFHAAAMAIVNSQARGLGYDDQVRPQAILIVDVLPSKSVAVLLLHGPRHVNGDVVGYTSFLE